MIHSISFSAYCVLGFFQQDGAHEASLVKFTLFLLLCYPYAVLQQIRYYY